MAESDKWTQRRDKIDHMLDDPWTNGGYALVAVVGGLIFMLAWSLLT